MSRGQSWHNEKTLQTRGEAVKCTGPGGELGRIASSTVARVKKLFNTQLPVSIWLWQGQTLACVVSNIYTCGLKLRAQASDFINHINARRFNLQKTISRTGCHMAATEQHNLPHRACIYQINSLPQTTLTKHSTGSILQ